MDNEENNTQTTKPSKSTEDSSSSASSTLGTPAAPKKRTVRKPKPTVEGINSPITPPEVSSSITPPHAEPSEPTLERPIFVEKKPVFTKPNLTEEEKELIIDEDAYAKKFSPEPKLMPKAVVGRAVQKRHPVRASLYVLLVLAIIGAAVYKLYKNPITNWFSKEFYNSSEQANNLSYSLRTTQNNNPTPPATPTTTSTPVATPTTTPVTAAPAKTLTIKDTPTGYLNVRSGPSTANTLVTQVHPNETYPYIESKSGWYEITLPNGQNGWVIGQYVGINK